MRTLLLFTMALLLAGCSAAPPAQHDPPNDVGIGARADGNSDFLAAPAPGLVGSLVYHMLDLGRVTPVSSRRRRHDQHGAA